MFFNTANKEGCVEVVAKSKDVLYPIHSTLVGASHRSGLDFQPYLLLTLPFEEPIQQPMPQFPHLEL